MSAIPTSDEPMDQLPPARVESILTMPRYELEFEVSEVGPIGLCLACINYWVEVKAELERIDGIPDYKGDRPVLTRPRPAMCFAPMTQLKELGPGQIGMFIFPVGSCLEHLVNVPKTAREKTAESGSGLIVP